MSMTTREAHCMQTKEEKRQLLRPDDATQQKLSRNDLRWQLCLCGEGRLLPCSKRPPLPPHTAPRAASYLSPPTSTSARASCAGT